MNKRVVFQIFLVAALLGGTIYFIARAFKPGPIQIVCDIHPPRPQRPNRNNARPPATRPAFDIAFGLDQQYELTSVEVVPLDEWTTNKDAHPFWYLVSETNSAPTKAFFYGMGIRGMHAAVKGARAELLQTNVVYHLILQAGSRGGEYDFKIPVSSAPAE